MSVLAAFGAIVLFAALFAVGGASALIPEFYRQIVEVHAWITPAAFAHAIALAQVAPGPNVLLVSLLGWQIAGVAGLLVATGAIVGPPSLLSFAVGRFVRRVQDAPWLAAVKKGLGPVLVGLMLASGLVITQAADHDAIGFALTGMAAVYMLAVKRNPLWVIAAGAALGMLAYRFGLVAV